MELKFVKHIKFTKVGATNRNIFNSSKHNINTAKIALFIAILIVIERADDYNVKSEIKGDIEI